MGKKKRNRVNQPKKNNNISQEDLLSKEIAHEKEFSSEKRKR